LASSSSSSSNGTTGTSFLRSHLLRLAPYTPIEPFEILSAKYGRSPQDIVKLDANENPYGPPPEVREALAAMPFPHIYPDPETRRLRKALAEWNDIPMENLLVSTVLAAHPQTSSSDSSFCNRTGFCNQFVLPICVEAGNYSMSIVAYSNISSSSNNSTITFNNSSVTTAPCHPRSRTPSRHMPACCIYGVRMQPASMVPKAATAAACQCWLADILVQHKMIPELPSLASPATTTAAAKTLPELLLLLLHSLRQLPSFPHALAGGLWS